MKIAFTRGDLKFQHRLWRQLFLLPLPILGLIGAPTAIAEPIGRGHILVTTQVIGGSCCGGGNLLEFTRLAH